MATDEIHRRRPWRLALLGAAVFVATLVVNAPASTLLQPLRASGLSYASAKGTVWNGVIEGAVFDRTAFGTISFRAPPLGFLSGRLVVVASATGGAIEGGGRFSVGLGGDVHATGVDANVELGRFRRYGFMGAPLEGNARISVERLVISASGCRTAVGTVWTNALKGPAKRLGGSAFDLSGAARCDDKDLVVDLAGEGEEGGANLELRLKPGFVYALAASAAPRRTEVEQALVIFGFERGERALTYESTGQLRRAGS